VQLPAEEAKRKPVAESFPIPALLSPGTPLGPDALSPSVKTPQETLMLVQLVYHGPAAAKHPVFK
jgi:hypothetical protein